MTMVTAAIWPALDYSRVPYRLYHDAEIYAREQERIFQRAGVELSRPRLPRSRSRAISAPPMSARRRSSSIATRPARSQAFVNRCAHRGALVRRELSRQRQRAHLHLSPMVLRARRRLTAIPFRRGIRGKGGLDPSFDMARARPAPAQGRHRQRRDVRHAGRGRRAARRLSRRRRSWRSCDRLFDRPVRVLGYNRQRIRGNWKLYAENTRDNYHASLLHEFLVTFGLDRSTQVGGVKMDARHRHNITWAEADSDTDESAHAGLRRRPGAQRLPVAAGAGARRLPPRARRPAQPRRSPRSFPSAVFVQISNSLAIRQIRPRGVDEVEVFQTMLGYEDDPPEMTLHRLRQANLVGPAGLVSMEDGEAIEIAHRASRPDPDRTTVIELGGGGAISDRDYRVNDVPLRGFWSYYAELLGIEPEGAVR